MPYYLVRRKVYENYPVKEWDNEQQAEDDACNDTEGWDCGDVEYFVEEVDPVELGILSREEVLEREVEELRMLLNEVVNKLNVVDLDDSDLLKRIAVGLDPNLNDFSVFKS